MWSIRFNWSSMCMKWSTAPAHISLGPGPQLWPPGTISLGLIPQPPSPTPNVPPIKNDWDTLFFLMFDEYFNPSPSVVQPVLVAAVQELVVSIGTTLSTRIDQDTPSIKVTEKQAGNVQTSLTLSSAKLKIQSMVDVPIHQEDLVVQRTPLINTIISMVTDNTASTPTTPTIQAHV
nr:hypothetical protein [Tanacetum cinerariifolium]